MCRGKIIKSLFRRSDTFISRLMTALTGQSEGQIGCETFMLVVSLACLLNSGLSFRIE
jgi:hypothetical protein